MERERNVEFHQARWCIADKGTRQIPCREINDKEFGC